MVHEIAVTRVKVKPGRRPVRNADALAKSIGEIGLLNPISVTPSMVLIAGGRRLEAFKILGKSMIPANVLTLDDLHAELAEIDENLERSELTELEQGEQYARRKEIYEAIHPESKPIQEKGGPGRGHKKTDETVSPVSFAEDTAKKAGVSARSVQQSIQIAGNIDSEVKEMIKGTDLEDRKVDLLGVARLPKKQQKPVVEEVLKNKKTTVSKAKENLGLSKPKPAKATQSLADKLFPASPTNGPVGKSKVNGEIVDDPPDVAAARALGKIAPDVMPEITESVEGATIESVSEEIEEQKAMTDDSLSDEDWLATLPLYSQLADICLKTFREDALAYRDLEKHRKTFIYHVTRTINKCRRKGPYSFKLKWFLALDHPKDWVKCSDLQYGGCGGIGTSPLTGSCSTCHGSGYRISG